MNKRRPSTTDKELLVRIDAAQDEQMRILTSILEEAKKTNGRVKTLEEYKAHSEEKLKNLTKNNDDNTLLLNEFREFRAQFRGSWKLASLIGAVVGGLVSLIGLLVTVL